MKKNNNGFSLVELIVVVLIMAIIAVALAPQVMKWVENSRKSTDCNNYDSVVSAVNIALANEKAYEEVVKAGGVTLTWTKVDSGDAWAIAPAVDGKSTNLFDAQIKATLGDDWKEDLNIKRTDAPDDGYEIVVDAAGTVNRTGAPSANDIS